MPYINDNAYDALLNYVKTNGTRLDICSSEPASYAAVAGVSLGYKATPAYTGPADRAGSGRKITVNAFSGAEVTGTGTASHYAITDGAAILVATGTLPTPQVVTDGNTFSLAAFDIGVPDAA